MPRSRVSCPPQALAPLLKLHSSPPRCSKSNGFVQIGCTLYAGALNTRNEGLHRGTEGSAGGRGRESSPAERSVHHGGSAPLRGRVRVVKGGARKTEPDARGVGSDRVTWPRPRWSSTVTATRSASSFCRAARPAAAADDDPVPRTLPSGTRWPRIMLLPLPELVRPPPLLNFATCSSILSYCPRVAALVVMQGPEPRVQVGANQNKRRERETERG